MNIIIEMTVDQILCLRKSLLHQKECILGDMSQIIKLHREEPHEDDEEEFMDLQNDLEKVDELLNVFK